MPKYDVDISMVREVEAVDLGHAVGEAIESGLAAGWKVRNVFVNEQQDEKKNALQPLAAFE